MMTIPVSILDPRLVKLARDEEIREGIRKYKVYSNVPIKACIDKTGKAPIGTRWVDVNKGDKVHPEFRSRLVAKEIKVDNRMDLFAATPPLELKKTLMKLAVTEGIGYCRGRKHQGMHLAFMDVKKAYYASKTVREFYVKLPEGDDNPECAARLTEPSLA